MVKKALFDELKLTAVIDGKEIIFTKKEFSILKFLYDNQERPFSRDEIIERIFPEYDAFDRTIDAFIKLIRKKIGQDKIKTIYKKGYRYIN